MMKRTRAHVFDAHAAPLLSIVFLVSALVANPALSAIDVSSTFTEDNVSGPPGDAITIVNSSMPGTLITSITIDLTASVGDVVFDPDNTSPPISPSITNVAGDAGAVGGLVFSDGFVVGPRTVFRMMSLDFGHFEPGEEIRINVDLDALAGVDAFITGGEFAGAALVVSFFDGMGSFTGSGDYSSAGPSSAIATIVPLPAAIWCFGPPLFAILRRTRRSGAKSGTLRT